MFYFNALCAVVLLLVTANQISYRLLKGRIVRSRSWGLNICCGNTDGGGVNCDIVPRDVPNFRQVDIYRLPFADKTFDTVLCSHTMEHVDDPDAFHAELRRVGAEVVVVLPPLWDVAAALNFLEHRWLFFSLGKVHRKLPLRVALYPGLVWQAAFGQRVKS